MCFEEYLGGQHALCRTSQGRVGGDEVRKRGQGPDHEDLQEIVGGYIECVGVFDNILCVCNEEGKMRKLPPNFILNGDIIVGDVFFCAGGEEDFESLDDEQIETIMNILYVFESKNK